MLVIFIIGGVFNWLLGSAISLLQITFKKTSGGGESENFIFANNHANELGGALYITERERPTEMHSDSCPIKFAMSSDHYQAGPKLFKIKYYVFV